MQMAKMMKGRPKDCPKYVTKFKTKSGIKYHYSYTEKDLGEAITRYGTAGTKMVTYRCAYFKPVKHTFASVTK